MPDPPLARYVDIRPMNLFFLRVFNESLRVSAFFLISDILPNAISPNWSSDKISFSSSARPLFIYLFTNSE